MFRHLAPASPRRITMDGKDNFICSIQKTEMVQPHRAEPTEEEKVTNHKDPQTNVGFHSRQGRDLCDQLGDEGTKSRMS